MSDIICDTTQWAHVEVRVPSSARLHGKPHGHGAADGDILLRA